MNSGLHRIVVVGGGAGGLGLATRLGKRLGKHRLASAILIDSSPTHIWKPLLHEVATGALNTGEDEVNYFAHAHQNGYEFVFGRMNGLNRTKKLVKLAPLLGQDGKTLVQPREIQYDTLVLAVGAITNDFGTKGVRENCIFLNTPADAEYLRRQILGQALSVVTGNSVVPKLRIGIIGGGATGVELAAEIYHTVCELRQYGSNLLQEQLQITVLEGANRILCAAPQSLSDYATEQLTKRNIEVKTNCQVKEVTPEGFVLQNGQILPAEIKIWTAGIKAPDWVKDLGLPVTKTNQIILNDTLQCIEDSSIFGLGDCTQAPDPFNIVDGSFLPATAQVAHQQAQWLTDKLSTRLQNRPCKPFKFKPLGMIVSLGEGSAAASLIAVIGPKQNYYFDGRSAKLMYASLYRMHQAVLYGWTRAVLLWIGSKLRKVALPQLKLH